MTKLDLGGDSRQELIDFLRQFDITVRDGQDISRPDGSYYRVLLESMKLLPDGVYEGRSFTHLILWGGTNPHFPNGFGYFRNGWLEINENVRDKATFLGLTYTFLHEFGHSVEHLFPELPGESDEHRLPEEYYEHRNRCTIPNRFHDWTAGDLLIYFALATKQDIEKWYNSKVEQPDGSSGPYILDESIEAVERFRERIVGDPNKRLEQMKAFIDLVEEAEKLKGGVYTDHFGLNCTEQYRKTLGALRERIHNPRKIE